jgi:O-antigen/teichoic acid export membrane protein
MLEHFKRLVSQSAVYGLSGILNAAINFLLVPVYARYLTPADYGVLTVLTVTATFVSVLLQLGISTAIFRSVIHRDVQKGVVFSTAFYFLLAVAAVCFAVLFSSSETWSALLLDDVSPPAPRLVNLALMAVVWDTLAVVTLAKLRIEERALLYSSIAVVGFLLGVLLTIYFVVVKGQGVLGVMTANSIRSVVQVVVAVIILMPDLGFTFSVPELVKLLRFGLPLVPVSVAALVLSIGNRYFLRHFTSMSTVGIYSMGHKIAGVLQLPVSAFQVAWPTLMFSLAKSSQGREFYSKLLTYFVLVMGIPVLGLSVFARELVLLVTAPSYYDAWVVIPFLLLSQLLVGIYYVTAVGVNLKSRTEYLILAWGLGVGAYLALNFYLVPGYGMLGAAVATLISYTCVTIASTYLSLRLYPVAYQYTRLLKFALVVVILYLTSLLIPSQATLAQVALKSLLVIALPVILWLTGFFSAGEVAQFRAWVRIWTLKGRREALGLDKTP